MATNGPVSIQGCAFRATRLNTDGSCGTGSLAMIQDNLNFVKLELKPNMEPGVEITPKSACGVPVISYKDCDRYKRWDVTLTLGDWDPEAMELLAGGAIYTSTGSSGRTFADGSVVINTNDLTSASLANFTANDVGRSVSGTGIPSSPAPYITEYISATHVKMSAVATSTAGPESITLGAQVVGTIGYAYPHLLQIPCPNGVAIEVWSKLIVRGTGYQGTTPYPSAGSPTIPGSAYVRHGVFRCFLWHDADSIEDKEQTPMLTGWAIENPNFGTGPNDDWRVSATPATGAPLDTTVPRAMMCDVALPTPLVPGYQTPLI
jgi:hypothetical protein